MGLRRTAFFFAAGEFVIDAVYSAEDLYMTLECRHCSFVGDMDVPLDLYDLNRQASEHRGMCTGEKE